MDTSMMVRIKQLEAEKVQLKKASSNKSDEAISQT